MQRIAAAVRSRLFLARWLLIDAAGAVHRRVPRTAVALTFDDGPHPEWTPRVLEVLAAHDVTATFFCVGDNARRHPEVVRSIEAAGHAVGSHSATHRIPTAAPLRAFREFTAGRLALEQVLGRPTTLFRPPHGHLDVLTAGLCRLRGLSTWLWTVDAADWLPNRDAGALVDRFVAVAREGDVLLMHDWIEEPIDEQACDRSSLVEALPQVIEGIRAKGLRFVRLS